MTSADGGQQLEGFVARLVEAGRYNSRSEVLQEGACHSSRTTRPASPPLDTSIARGLSDADAGRIVPAATVFDRLEVKYRGLAETAE